MKILGILAFVFIFSGVNGQKSQLGYLNVRNIPPSEYNGTPQTFMSKEDNRGVLYFTNNLGMFSYDGTNYQLHHVRNDAVVKSIDISNKNTNYVGGVDEFGYFKSGDMGKLIYQSLSDTNTDFGQIFNTVILNGNVYFQSKKSIFVYNEVSKKLSEIPSENLLKEIRSTSFGLIGLTKTEGVFLYKNGELKSFDQFEFIKNKLDLNDILQFDDKTFYGITKEKEFVKINIESKKYEVLNKFEEHLVKITALNNNEVILTTNSGVIRLSLSGETIEVYNKLYGIIEENCHDAFLTSNKELVITTDYGLSIINLSSKLRKIDERLGFASTVESIRFTNDIVSLAGNKGIFNVYNNKLIKSDFTSLDAWDVFSFKNNKQIAALNDGVYSLLDNKSKRIFDCFPWYIHQSKVNSNYYYIGLDPGLMVIHETPKGWVTDTILDVPFDIRFIEEDDNGNIWGSGTSGAIMISSKKGKIVDNLTLFESDQNGLPKGGIYPKFNGKKVYFGTDKGLMEYDFNQIKFKITSDFGDKFKNYSGTVFRLDFDNKNRLWAYLIHNVQEKEVGYLDNNYAWISGEFFEIHDQVNSIKATDNNVWIGTVKSLYKYDLNQSTNVNTNQVKNIIKTIRQSDSTFYFGFGLDKNGLVSFYLDTVLEFDYNKEALEIEFSRPQFSFKEGVEYKYMLEGFMNHWSEWNSKTKASFTNLPEGTYTFKLISRLNNTSESSETSFVIKILPPWYRTWWAYTLYLLFLGTIVYVIIVWRTKALKERQKELEHEVEIRTLEVVEQKNEAEKQRDIAEHQKHIIEEKNEEITASINYASRIQQAVLTSEEYMNHMFNSYFVFYQPRDIVSGDFYWAYQTNNGVKIWVAADCTGHGVPGGFMSMLGMSALNQIVVEDDIISAENILNSLRANIIHAFEKTKGDAERKDGMDIGLCVYNPINNTLEFSGAYNPMYLVRKLTNFSKEYVEEEGKLIVDGDWALLEFKANKMPCAKHLLDHEPFTKETFNILPDDRVFTFTDGFPDQFGGPDKKKYMSKRFKKYILEIQNHEMTVQHEMLKNEFANWLEIGGTKQIDDVCVVGVKF